MKFEYVEYGESLIKNLEKNPNIIYIFSDYSLKNTQMKESNRNIFEPDPIYLTIEEFRDEIYKTEKTILSEAKRFVSLYNELKKEFSEININSYFESVDFSDKFFKYFAELNRSLCDKEIILEEWQKKYFEIFHKFKNKYDDYLMEKNYIPKDWVENINNLDLTEIIKYKKIYFVDVINFSTLDKLVLSKLNEDMEVVVRIQGEKDIFDEEKLELKNIYLPTEQKINLSIMKVQDELELIGNLLDTVKNKKETLNIFSPEADTNEYSKIFSNDFMRNNFKTLNDTKFFKFLTVQSELIGAIENRIEEKYIPIQNFLRGIKNLEMQEYYKLEKEDMEYIYNQINRDYKYIGNEDNEKINKIYKDVLEISKIKDIKSFIKYFNELLSLDMFKENIYLDFYDKLQEYMGYATTTEIMLEEKDLKNCFKTGGDILKFLLQYFNNVEIILNENAEGKYLIKPLENSKNISSKEAIFINLTTKYLPKQKRDYLYLTEKQKKDNGFSYYEKERKEEKYRLYQAILKNKNNTLIYIENENTGEVAIPIISEILNRYDVNKLEKNIFSEDILEILIKAKTNSEIKFIQEELKKNITDFSDGKLSVGPYDYDKLSKCEYRFYLDKIHNLTSFETEDQLGISVKFLGIYVHDVFEKITDRMWKQILNLSDYKIEYSEVEELLKKSFYKNRKKISLSFDNYFIQVLIPRFAKNVVQFYNEIENLYIEKKVKRIESEKNSKKEPFVKSDIEIILNGRVDLVIETTNEKHVIDFKTGGKIDNQLDFYSIMLYGDELAAKKSIYNAFEGKLENQDDTKLTKDILKEKLMNFIKNDTYRLAEKKNSCSYCEYEEICRRDVV